MATDSARRPPTLDAVAAQRWARLAPAGVSPWLHEEVGRRMEDRLQWIKAQPRQWANWAPLRGGREAHALVAQRYPKSQGLLIEPEPGLHGATAQALGSTGAWWRPQRWLGGSAMPVLARVPEGGVDLLWANMALHMAAHPEALIAEWHRSVAVDGFLMFSCLGPDTLGELRTAYIENGWPPPDHDFTDMHDWGDMLVHAGFAEPVMDMERVVLTWSTPEAALAELRGLGRNLHTQRFGALRGRRWLARLREALEGLRQPSDGRIALTFEIIHGHAFRPAARVALAPESAVPLGDMRAMLRGRRP